VWGVNPAVRRVGARLLVRGTKPNSWEAQRIARGLSRTFAPSATPDQNLWTGSPPGSRGRQEFAWPVHHIQFQPAKGWGCRRRTESLRTRACAGIVKQPGSAGLLNDLSTTPHIFRLSPAPAGRGRASESCHESMASWTSRARRPTRSGGATSHAAGAPTCLDAASCSPSRQAGTPGDADIVAGRLAWHVPPN
jgi:hypothetical protein